MLEEIRPGASFGALDSAVTKSDTADLLQYGGRYPRAIRVNGAGDVKIMAPDGTTSVWTCAGPETLAQQVRRVFATGTTVTASIVPIY
jgi:hypothetical protein